MLTFNDLLAIKKIKPEQVLLLRHAEKTKPYQLFLKSSSDFNLYQSLQTEKNEIKHPYVASFVSTPLRETLFVGLYKNNGCQGKAPIGTVCPVHNRPVHDDHYLYDLEITDVLHEYIEKMVIDWGDLYIDWHQEAANKNKAILEIRQHIKEKPFPGFYELRYPIKDLELMPMSWRAVLSQMKGIYLLVCNDTGKQYVGAADGSDGFWGRWQDYHSNGHGGNKNMIPHKTSGYVASILEIVHHGNEQIIGQIETSWKEKLQTRKFGLNAN